jgi:hypothetical protein
LSPQGEPARLRAALRFVQTPAGALGLGYKGAHPKAMLDGLRTARPILGEPCAGLRRPGQSRAEARVVP